MFTKIYEMKYLAGVLVGNQMVAENWDNHVVGVVAAIPIVEQFRHINAFIRGCVEADPLCRVAVVWIDTFYDPYAEQAAGWFRKRAIAFCLSRLTRHYSR
jgi:basic membrane protein A